MNLSLSAGLGLGKWEGRRTLNGAGSGTQERVVQDDTAETIPSLVQLRQCFRASSLLQNWSAANCEVSQGRHLFQTASLSASPSSLTPGSCSYPTPCWEQSTKFWSEKTDGCSRFHICVYRRHLGQGTSGQSLAYGAVGWGSLFLNGTREGKTDEA